MAENEAKPRTNNFLGVTTSQRNVINASQAQAIIEAAAAEAEKIGQPQNIAVSDPSGFLVAFRRMDSAFLGSIDISQKKAKTVAMYNGAYTTADFYNLAQPGGPLYAIEQTNNGLIPFGGGVPVVIDGVFIGAVGVSGGSVEEDIQVANAGVRAVGGYLPA